MWTAKHAIGKDCFLKTNAKQKFPSCKPWPSWTICSARAMMACDIGKKSSKWLNIEKSKCSQQNFFIKPVKSKWLFIGPRSRMLCRAEGRTRPRIHQSKSRFVSSKCGLRLRSIGVHTERPSTATFFGTTPEPPQISTKSKTNSMVRWDALSKWSSQWFSASSPKARSMARDLWSSLV